MADQGDFTDDCQPKSEPSLEEIEASLSTPDKKAEHHLFRTFLLLNPKGSSKDWEEFKSVDLVQHLSRSIKTLPIFKILLLFRRHPSIMPFFLKSFDSIKELRSTPKSYLPFFEQMIVKLPIQWIVRHMLKIEDVRYAYHFLNVAFSDYITGDPNILDTRKHNDEIYEEYRKIVPQTAPMSFDEAWVKLLSLRSSMRELMDIKLKVSFASYERLAKPEFVKRLLNGSSCDSVERYTNTLKTQIIPFCTINNILIQPIITSTLAQKEWPVEQKLEIILKYIDQTDEKKNALRNITFTSESEIQTIIEFAKRINVDFVPDPSRYIDTSKQKPKRQQQQRVGRSPSIGFANVGKPTERSPLYLDLYRLSPKSTTSNVGHKLIIYTSLSQLGNGDPPFPDEYAKKLEHYTVFSDISSIYTLSKKFGVIVTYESFQLFEDKKKLFIELLELKGASYFIELIQIFKFNENEIFDIIFEIKKCCVKIIPYVIQYVTRSNFDNFLRFVKQIIFNIETENINEICILIYNALINTIDVANSVELLNIIFLIHILKGIYTSDKLNDLQKSQIISNLKNNENSKIIELLKDVNDIGFLNIAFPGEINTPDLQSKEDFIKKMSSTFSEDFIETVSLIQFYDKETVIDYLMESKRSTSGILYTRLYFIDLELSRLGIDETVETQILKHLYASYNHSIDFHFLLENPKEVLNDSLSLENINELLQVASLLSVPSDELYLNLMINKMNSPNFEEYKPFIEQLNNKEESYSKLIEAFPNKLTHSSELQFYKFINRIDLMKTRETIFDLTSFGLKTFLDNKFTSNPKYLITEIYTKTQLYEKLGAKIHELTKKIANRYEIDFDELKFELVQNWLNDNNSKSVQETESIFTEIQSEVTAKDDQVCIQKCIFVLRSLPTQSTAECLLKIVEDENISFRTRHKAILCLLSFTDVSFIRQIFSDKFDFIIQLNSALYYASKLEVYGIKSEISDFDPMNVNETIQKLINTENLSSGAYPVLFELCINYKINDKQLLIQITDNLIKYKKKFILQNIDRFFGTFPDFADDQIFKDLFINVLSLPVNEMLTNPRRSKPFRTQHNIVISIFFNLISSESTCQLDGLRINDQYLKWDEIVDKLCKSGFAQFAAEMGAYIIDIKQRSKVLMTLLKAGHFDEALQFGFDKDSVFSYIVKEAIEQATETMIDEHFVQLTAWLKQHDLTETIEIVKETLAKQGRTMEVKRMTDRLTKIQVFE